MSVGNVCFFLFSFFRKLCLAACTQNTFGKKMSQRRTVHVFAAVVARYKTSRRGLSVHTVHTALEIIAFYGSVLACRIYELF